MEDGFDFLGFNSRHYGGKLLIKPSKKKVLAFCKRIGKEVKNHNGAEQEALIKKRFILFSGVLLTTTHV